MKRYGRGGVVYVSPYKSTQIKHNVQVDCTVILSERNTLSESVVTASTRVSVTKLMFYELPILRSNSHYINFLKELVKLLTSPCECSGAARCRCCSTWPRRCRRRPRTPRATRSASTSATTTCPSCTTTRAPTSTYTPSRYRRLCTGTPTAMQAASVAVYDRFLSQYFKSMFLRKY